jgi:hypothetical protein
MDNQPYEGFPKIPHIPVLITCTCNLANSSCGELPICLHHKIEGGKKKEKNCINRTKQLINHLEISI